LTQAYIAIPLADLAPAYHHPQTKQPLEEIADALSKSNIHKTNITL
jgi:7,8-dihydro-6-hydroxymethylpterin-pyrophosphokinase